MAEDSNNSNLIPLATPYPWSPDELECYKSLSHVKNKRQRVVGGSGYATLASSLSRITKPRTKSILESLLKEHYGTLHKGNETTHKTTNSMHDVINNALDNAQTQGPPSLPPQPTTNKAGDSAIPPQNNESTKRDDGLFVSLLRVISLSAAPVSTRHLLRTCSLIVTPGHVPPHMDCKEYVLAALYFLSSEHKNKTSSGLLCDLPLIETTPKSQDDLEKRSYQKLGSWSLEDPALARKLRVMENLFGTSSDNWTCLGRQRHLPLGITLKEEELLLLKGTLPSLKAKKDSTKKRKAPATKQEDTATPPVAAAPTTVPVIDTVASDMS